MIFNQYKKNCARNFLQVWVMKLKNQTGETSWPRSSSSFDFTTYDYEMNKINLSWKLKNGISLIPICKLIWRLLTRGEQVIFNLEINKKRRSSSDLDIHHSKVFSSELGTLEWWISRLMLNPLFLLISRLKMLNVSLEIKYLDQHIGFYKNARLVRFPDLKGLQLILNLLFINTLDKMQYIKWPKTNSWFVRNCGFLPYGIEFIIKAVIGQCNLRTIFLHSHWRK